MRPGVKVNTLHGNGFCSSFSKGYFPYNFWYRPYKFLTKKNEKKKKENICHLLFKGTTFKGNFLGSSHHQHGEENNWWGLNPGGQQKSIFLSRLINCDMRRYLAQLYWGTVSWYCENMCICISSSNYKSKERGFYFLFFIFWSLHLIYQLFKSIFTSHNRSFKICSFLFSLLFWFPNFCAFINFHGANASWASTYFISQNCL